VGDEVLLFNGRDGEWRAHISAVGKKSVELMTTFQTRAQPYTKGPVLAIALVKRNRLETIIEKATELGARQIQLLITRRTNADHTNIERLKSIAIEAAEQTERLDVPDILTPIKLLNWLSEPAVSNIYFGDEETTEAGYARPSAPLLTALSAEVTASDMAVLIGPEGGFDEEERTHLHSLPYVRAVALGPRILRADTAAIAALTLCQSVSGDWR
jgi:16S rRNA (uracil1498-N3)-methyltransferase